VMVDFLTSNKARNYLKFTSAHCISYFSLLIDSDGGFFN